MTIPQIETFDEKTGKGRYKEKAFKILNNGDVLIAWDDGNREILYADGGNYVLHSDGTFTADSTLVDKFLNTSSGGLFSVNTKALNEEMVRRWAQFDDMNPYSNTPKISQKEVQEIDKAIEAQKKKGC